MTPSAISQSQASAPRLGAHIAMRLEVEEFLFYEAELLDAWRLDEWFALFAPDGRYVVPSTDRPEGDPSRTLALIDDDHVRLKWRVERLKSRHAHREYPYSRTRRIISNVRVADVREDELDVRASMVLYRYRYERADDFVCAFRHTLVRTPDGLRFRLRRAELDPETLSPNGALSMIL